MNIKRCTAAQVAAAYAYLNDHPPAGGQVTPRWLTVTLNELRAKLKVPYPLAQAALSRALHVIPFIKAYKAELTQQGFYGEDPQAQTQTVSPLVFAAFGDAPIAVGGVLDHAEIILTIRTAAAKHGGAK